MTKIVMNKRYAMKFVSR